MTYLESQIISVEQYEAWLWEQRYELLKELAQKAPAHVSLTDLLAVHEDWDLQKAADVAENVIEVFRQ